MHNAVDISARDGASRHATGRLRCCHGGRFPNHVSPSHQKKTAVPQADSRMEQRKDIPSLKPGKVSWTSKWAVFSLVYFVSRSTLSPVATGWEPAKWRSSSAFFISENWSRSSPYSWWAFSSSYSMCGERPHSTQRSRFWMLPRISVYALSNSRDEMKSSHCWCILGLWLRDPCWVPMWGLWLG